MLTYRVLEVRRVRGGVVRYSSVLLVDEGHQTGDVPHLDGRVVVLEVVQIPAVQEERRLPTKL